MQGVHLTGGKFSVTLCLTPKSHRAIGLQQPGQQWPIGGCLLPAEFLGQEPFSLPARVALSKPQGQLVEAPG